MRTLFLIVCSVFYTALYAGDTERFDSISSQINNLSFTHMTKVKGMLAEMHSIAKKHPENSRLSSVCLYSESYLNYSQGIADTALASRIKEHLKIPALKKQPFEYGVLLQAAALNDVIAGNYADALTYSLQALTLFKSVGNELFASRACQILGVTCYRTRNFEMSEKFSKQSLSENVPRVEYYKAMINMFGAQVFILGKSKKAQQSMLNLIPKFRNEKDRGLLAVLYLNLGATYYMENLPEKGYEYFKMALDTNEFIENGSFKVSCLVNVSAYFLGIRNYDTAKNYIKEAEGIALKSNNAEQLSIVYNVMARLYDSIGDISNAYTYLKKYNSMMDDLLNRSKAIDSYEAYVSSFLDSAEKEVNLTKQNSVIEKRRLTNTLVLAVFIILLVVAMLIILQQKKRRQAIVKEAEKQALEKELQYEKSIQQMQEEKHREMIDAKLREVTSYSLMLSNKNNVLQEVFEEATNLKKSSNEENQPAFKKIIAAINDSLNNDAESSKFIYHFNEVHPDFFTKLKSVCADLTENNLRICAYFKMGISPKQVATILNISVETVKNARYRLKKKLGLGEEENLDDFIRNI